MISLSGCLPGLGQRVKIKPEEQGCAERCCPGFWEDNGVPPVPGLSWVFDPNNKYLNDNKYAEKFGAVGYKYADSRRKHFMGVALAVTVCAFIVTWFGCFALSTDDDIIRYTAWGTAWYRNDTTGVATKFYIGLTDFVVIECVDAYEDDSWDFTDCHKADQQTWSEIKRSDIASYYFPWSAVKKCRDQAIGNQFGAFSTAATLIFALIGCLTRMRKVADTNFQKVIACLPDTFGVFSLGSALINFADGCYSGMPNRVHGMEVTYWVGAGYLGYCCCLCAAFIRVILHYATPVPGKGCDGACCDKYCEFIEVEEQSDLGYDDAKSNPMAKDDNL